MPSECLLWVISVVLKVGLSFPVYRQLQTCRCAGRRYVPTTDLRFDLR
jgi:hypothetical protein